MQRTPATLDFYEHTTGVFLAWIEHQGITSPDKMNACHVCQYLAELTDQAKQRNLSMPLSDKSTPADLTPELPTLVINVAF